MLWYAPIYSGLLLISASARRMPILWATLPFLTIAIVEEHAFNTLHFYSLTVYRLGEGLSGNNLSMTGIARMDLNPSGFLVTPGLWIGLATPVPWTDLVALIRLHIIESFAHRRRILRQVLPSRITRFG